MRCILIPTAVPSNITTLTRQRLKEAIPAGIFTAVYLLIAAFLSVSGANWEFVFYIVVVLILAGFATWVHIRVGLTRGILMALALWGFLHMLGGLMPVPETWYINGDKCVLYSLWLIPDLLKYDHVIHAYGFAVATIVCWQSLRTMIRIAIPTTGALVLCVLGGMGLGAINEIVEFIAVLMIPNTNVGGYINTGWDLVANAAGTLLAAGYIRLKG